MESDQKAEDQCCGTCWWHDTKHRQNGVCCHDQSDFYGDITDDTFCCDKYVGIGKVAEDNVNA